MQTVTSKDGTRIAYDAYGAGPAVILIGGALQQRAGDGETAKLAKTLGEHFTAIHYDRRGRGDSTDTLPFAVEREIEDIEALIDANGGTAAVFGMSSGGALAMETTLKLGRKIRQLAIYEVPFNAEAGARQGWATYRKNLSAALAEGRKGDAAALFLTLVGMPAEAINGMRQSPAWGGFEAVAPTLAYDAAVLGDESDVPLDRAARVTVPTLLMVGGATYPFMRESALALQKVIPNAQFCVLEGQTHAVTADALVPVLSEFFTQE